uniref:translation initiation factor 1 n=1 Tax=Primula sinuata TaxID=3043452 RepID=UPI0030FE6376
MFGALLDNEDLNLGYISGKIRHSFIQILPEDRVKIKVRHSDSTRGRIIYQLPNKDSRDSVVFLFQLYHEFPWDYDSKFSLRN